MSFKKEILINSIIPNKEYSFKELAKHNKVPINKNKEFSSFLFSLVKAGDIFQTNDRKFFVPIFKNDKISGEIKINPNGFGFVDLDDGSSIFILKNNLNFCLDNDTVEVKYFESPNKKGQFQGVVTNILKRNSLEFVGTIKLEHNNLKFIPLNKKNFWKYRFIKKYDLKIDDQVKVKIQKIQDNFIYIELVSILGNTKDPFMDIKSLIEDKGIDSNFDQNIIDYAKKIPQEIDDVNSPENISRVDFRNKLIVTIDGEDTKDFDDAIHVEKIDDNFSKLFIHIADVSYYVKENDFLDKEAFNRGTSIYLIDRVIPMLPKELSNGICSLNPNVDRYTLTMETIIDKEGNSKESKIYPSIINSKYRLTYTEVNDLLNGKLKSLYEDEKLTNMIFKSYDLSKAIRTFKEKEGFVDFEIEESKIVLDSNGKTIDILKKERGKSEMMIEDFMIRANEIVAKTIYEHKIDSLYRIHAKPEAEKMLELKKVINVLGVNIDFKTNVKPLDFSKIISKIKEKRFDNFVKMLLLRTMSKAEYSSNNIGHFGLASKFYTHFTSPIRRYPDLIVHRILRECIFKNNKEKLKLDLNKIGNATSLAEQRAVDLERKVNDMKKVEFYENSIGQEIKGQIVTITKFGFFVEFENGAGGLVHISTLLDDEYKISNDGLCLEGKKSKFTIGDNINVKILRVLKSESKLDLIISNMWDEYQKEQKNEKFRKIYK